MAIVGSPRVFDKKFSFLVQFDFFQSLGFSKASAIEIEFGEVKHYEGGALTPDKSAGRMEFKDITFERGSTKNDWDMYLWLTATGNAAANVGVPDPFYKRHADVIQLDRAGEPSKIYSLFGCWPKSVTMGEWDNNADEVVIEKMTIAYDYFVRRL